MQKMPTYFPAPSLTKPTSGKEVEGVRAAELAEGEAPQPVMQSWKQPSPPPGKLRRSNGCQICPEFGIETPASSSCWMWAAPCWLHFPTSGKTSCLLKGLWDAGQVCFHHIWEASLLPPHAPQSVHLKWHLWSHWWVLDAHCVRTTVPTTQTYLAISPV